MLTNLKSLGYRSDLLFHRYDGAVVDRGEYIVATTESNPNYFWGNLLIYKKPPQKGDFAKWRAAFLKEITHPATYHMTFGWDSPAGEVGDVEEFLQQGFTLEKSVVLTATEVTPPPKFNSALEVRSVDSEEDFERCIQIQIATGGRSLSKEAFELFYRNQMARYRRLISQGKGRWFGAYQGGLIVGCLGIFSDNDIGRFQIVSTHPDFQRHGVCGTLVYKSAEYAFKKMNVKTLIMVADEEYHAARIYESVGFRPTEKMSGLSWYDKSKS